MATAPARPRWGRRDIDHHLLRQAAIGRQCAEVEAGAAVGAGHHIHGASDVAEPAQQYLVTVQSGRARCTDLQASAQCIAAPLLGEQPGDRRRRRSTTSVGRPATATTLTDALAAGFSRPPMSVPRHAANAVPASAPAAPTCTASASSAARTVHRCRIGGVHEQRADFGQIPDRMRALTRGQRGVGRHALQAGRDADTGEVNAVTDLGQGHHLHLFAPGHAVPMRQAASGRCLQRLAIHQQAHPRWQRPHALATVSTARPSKR